MKLAPQEPLTKELLANIANLKKELSIKEAELALINSNNKINDSQNFAPSYTDPVELDNRYKIISDLTSDFAYAFSVNDKKELKYEWGFGALFEITGYTREELNAKGGWETLLYTEDLNKALKQFELLLDGKANTQGE